MRTAIAYAQVISYGLESFVAYHWPQYMIEVLISNTLEID